MTFRFVHAADLHLDSPFKGIREAQPDVAKTLQRATFDAYENVINLCIERDVDALLVAGDIFDGADRSLAAQIQFVGGLNRLDEAGISAFICHGNHDPLDGWGANLTMPPNVHRFGAKAESVPLIPESPNSPLVCGVSYRTREERRSLLPGFPPPQPGRFTIGLIHANVGTDTGHESYAPCTLDELVATGYDYWALGHVHTRAVLREQAPMVVYAGNTQGRHINERGPRGVFVVEVDDDRHISREFVQVDTVRWGQLDFKIDAIEDDLDLFNRLESGVGELLSRADNRHLVYRIELSGRGPVHPSLARDGTIDDLVSQLNGVWLGRERFAFCGGIADRTRSELNRAALATGQDFIGDFLALSDQAAADEDLVGELQEQLSALYDSGRAKKYIAEDRPTSDAMRELITAAEDLALGLLVDDVPGG